jgi:hypothetical protein
MNGHANSAKEQPQQTAPRSPNATTAKSTASDVSVKPANATSSTVPQTSTPTATPAHTSISKPVTPAPTAKPTPVVISPTPNAIKLIVQTGGSVSFAADKTVPVRLQFTYTVVRDGSYTGPFSPNAMFQAGPGKPGDLYCGSGASGDVNSGTAEIVVNYNAPVGTYTCGIGIDLGYTRYETRYKLELTSTSLTILPSYEIIPGHSI